MLGLKLNHVSKSGHSYSTDLKHSMAIWYMYLILHKTQYKTPFYMNLLNMLWRGIPTNVEASAVKFFSTWAQIAGHLADDNLTKDDNVIPWKLYPNHWAFSGINQSTCLWFVSLGHFCTNSRAFGKTASLNSPAKLLNNQTKYIVALTSDNEPCITQKCKHLQLMANWCALRYIID